ncbi:MAG: DUF4434 domain-containing protein [Clostridia bacterium]|nr:DUF4434 domain-containing protein [Clostridia bacterium]
MRKTMSILLALILVISGIQFPIYAEGETSEIISVGCDYNYSYSRADMISGDINFKNLTDGILPSSAPAGEGWTKITLKNDTLATNAEGTPVTLGLFDDVDPHFYVKLDLGFKQEVHYITMDFSNDAAFSLPSKVEIMLSDDGYNYDIYKSQSYQVITSGQRTKFKVTFDEEITAKAIKFVAYGSEGAVMAIDEMEVYGQKLNNQVLLSQGSTYTWEGGELGGNYNGHTPATQLTDGVLSYMTGTTFDRQFIMKATRSRTDPETGYIGQEIILDLGSVKNVSKMKINSLYNSSGYTASDMDFVVFKYSTDGVTYHDFGTGYESGAGYHENLSTFARKIYSVSKNHTVEARYIKVFMACYGHIAIDEVQIYGSQTPVSEEFILSDREDRLEYTNLISYKGMYKDGVNQSLMTDQIFNEYTTYQDSTVILTGTFGAKYNEICGYNIYFKEKPRNIRLYLSTDNINWTLVSDNAEYYSLAGYTNAKAYFNAKVGTYYKFEIDKSPSNNISIAEIQIYNKQPHVPLMTGGFLAIYASETEGYNINLLGPNIEKNTDYDWEMQLKGYYNQGLRTIVLQHNVDYITKKSVMPIPVNSTLYNKGYRQRERLVSDDPFETILSIADKLSMKVYIGTIGTHSYNQIQSATGQTPLAHFQQVAEDGRAVIDQIEGSYGHHPSFVGYYFTDETCDSWLSSADGVAAFRTLYLTQSNEVRKIAPEKKTMISPAIWRTGNAATNATNLYNLIKADGTTAKPVVDVVSAQDCLGRLPSLIVSDNVYNTFENHVQWWAAKTRQAGVEFWHDAEIFEATYTAKRYSELVKSLEIEAKTSNKIIGYNLERITPAISGNSNSFNTFLIEAYRMEYAKRVASYIDELNIGTIPGSYQEEYGVNPRFDTNAFVKTDIAPLTDGRIINNQWNKFTPFGTVGENQNSSYAMMWDNTYIYFGVKTNDKTHPVQADGAWFGNASDYLILMLGKPSATGNAGEGANTIKIGISKKVSGVKYQVTRGTGIGEAAEGDIITAFDDTNPEGRTAIIAVKWSYLGLSPAAGLRFPISLAYCQDGTTWQTLNGYRGAYTSSFMTFTTATTSGSTNPFVKTDVAPSFNGEIIDNQWESFTNFGAVGEGEDSKYSMMWDDTYIYFGVKTNDKTHPVQADGAWFGNASDYLILMLGKPGATGNAGEGANTVKIGISKHVSGVEAQVSKGAGMPDVTDGDIVAGFDDSNPDGRTAVIAVKWSYLGITPSEGVTFPISLAYCQDGATWQTLNGYRGAYTPSFMTFTTAPMPPKTPLYNTETFVKTNSAPLLNGKIVDNQWNKFTSFSTVGENQSSSYAMMWDDTYIYFGIKTNDKTHITETTGTWFGNASDYLIIMLGKPGASGNAGAAADSIKLGICKYENGPSVQITKGEGVGAASDGDIIAAFDDTNPNGRTMVVAIKWSYLGLSPAAGTKFPISIAYCQDKTTWQTLNGYTGAYMYMFKEFVTNY